jgi:TetR/AcrR family transcriptional regulator, transcriptional repressor of bet genes
MSASSAKTTAPPNKRAGRGRQRQRLIEACISALHIHGPSRTTVEKVVAIAGMSPGIVRFYFDSKAAMLIASLQFLAAEFEEQLLLPVARLRDQPAVALERLVEMYVGPELASARKVSVWYAFWGEANSRQEYYDICGKKDESFDRLVRDLMRRLIEQTGAAHLDADAVALGLIGVLEMLWQGFAFQTEASIDRALARRRGRAYLRSLFPGVFAPDALGLEPKTAPNTRPSPLPAAEPGRDSWQAIGWANELAEPGAFLTAALAADRVLVVCDAARTLRAFRNRCGRQPHVLLAARAGRGDGHLICAVHGQRYRYDGTSADGDGPLEPLAVLVAGGLVFVREAAGAAPWLPAKFAIGREPAQIVSSERAVNSDWRVLVEQWIECALPEATSGRLAGLAVGPKLVADEDGGLVWTAGVGGDGQRWSARRYGRLAAQQNRTTWQRVLLPPNQLLDLRPDGSTLWRAVPDGPGRTRLVRLEGRPADSGATDLALKFLAQRLTRVWLEQDVEVAESIQASGAGGRERPASEAVARFRRRWGPAP